jgi:hypothetical protein
MKIVKKTLTLCVIILITPVLFFGHRYLKNPTNEVPYPFEFSQDIYSNQDINAPIVIIGDSMAHRLATFKDSLAEKMSAKLSKNIKIQIMSNQGDNIQRSLMKLKKLKKAPLVIIYMGNMDSSYESLFRSSQMDKINKNFSLYNNDYIRSLVMIYPPASRFIYWPLDRKVLSGNIIQNETKYSDSLTQKRLITNYKLYETGMKELINFAKKRGSFLIPITTPLNLNSVPKQSCYASMSSDGASDLQNLKDVLKQKDYKSAINSSSDLALIYSSNAQALYLHGLVSRKLNLREQSQKHLEMAIAYDCKNDRGNPVYNSILRKVSNQHQVEYFDFHQLLVDESYRNHTYLDDTYPQDVYFEKAVDVLAYKLKNLLKL